MISKMKHITVGALKKCETDMLYKLSWLSCLEVKPYEQFTVLGKDELTIPSNAERISKAEASANGLFSAIEFCEKYDHTKKKLFTPQSYISKKQMEDTEMDGEIMQACDKANRLSSEISSLKAKIAKCDTDISSLAPYMQYDVPLDDTSTRYTEILLGSFDKEADINELKDRLSSEVEGAYFSEISVFDARTYAAVFTMKKSSDDCLKLLSEYGFVKNNFHSEKLTAIKKTQELEKLKSELEEKLSETQKQTEEIAAKYLPLFKNAYDKALSSLNIEQLKAKIPTTETCIVLEGWYPEEREKELFSVLDKFICCYETREAEDGEDIPVELKNNKFASPFESIVSMYSLPSYKGMDATFVMSIFYFIAFGLMFADVGYGLILMLGGFLGPIILKSKQGTKKFLNLFGICGISCVISGILFGGYFGDLPIKIAENWFSATPPEFAKGLLFSPLTDPMSFLMVSLAFGFVQVLFGMALGGYMKCKHGEVLDGILDVIPWFIFIFGLFGMALGGLINTMPPAVFEISKWVTVGGLVSLVLTQGRHEKNVFMKLFKGITSLYDLVGILSDVLSYSRILALGLASSVIASVANLLATMSGLNVVGIIAFVIAFCFGHALNFALNVLGTYVHTSRLQFIEFFSRFYEDGGREFKPISVQTKYNSITYQEEN